MGDINKPPPKFVATGVRRPYSHKAVRHAIYRQLLQKAPKLDTVQSNSFNMNAVRNLWRRKLKVMQEQGWTALATKRALSYMSNCPPVGIVTNDRTNVCGQAGFCPFCYGRRLLNIFKDTERILYGDNHSREMIRPDLKLVAFRSQFALRYTRGKVDMPFLRQYVKYHARWEHTLFDGESSYAQYLIYPAAKSFQIVRSGFVLTKADVDARGYAALSRSSKACVFEPSKANLYKTVVEYMYYPPGMLSLGVNGVALNGAALIHGKLLTGLRCARMAFRFGRDLNSANEEFDDVE